MTSEYTPIVTSTTGLALLATVSIPAGTVIRYINSATAAKVVYQLRIASSPVPPTAVQPYDFNAATNNKAWFQC